MIHDIGSAEYKVEIYMLMMDLLFTESGKSLSFSDGQLTWGGDEPVIAIST